MADIVEFSTLYGHQRVFYKITSNAINFEVKGAGYAGIGLATKNGPECSYLVGLGVEGSSYIKKLGRQDKETADTPDILSDEEYRSFWISWDGHGIKVGRDGQPKPFVSYKCGASDLKYVSFFVTSRFPVPIIWKVQLPPIIEKPVSKSISGGELYWVPMATSTNTPDGAIIGGHEKENLYIIRAKHRGSLTPGKYVPAEGSAFISWGGEAHAKTAYEVLCGFDCMWVPSSKDKIPVGAVVGGHSESIEHEKLFVGRAKYLNHVIPGKVQPSHKVCYIAYDGREIGIEKYEILVVPEENRCANTILLPHNSMDIEELNEDYTDEDDVYEEEYEGLHNPNMAF